MDIFQGPRQRRLIMRWQRFLTDRKLFFGKHDGADSAAFRETVSAFQHERGLSSNGDITDTDTLSAAYEHGFDRDFEIGPDHDRDLCENRPYFVVPLDKGQSAMQDVSTRIADWTKQAAEQDGALLLRVSDTAEGQAQRPGEVQDPAGLLHRLRDAPPASAHGALRELLTCDTERRLKSLTWRAPADWDLIRTVVNEINSLLAGPCLTLLAEHLGKLPAGLAADLRNDDIGGQGRLLVNRRLLRLAFPDHIPELQERGPITDVFVFSHGWHRNFFAAVAAYDQLVSRFTLLLLRERLVPPVPFNPLFLAFHWHSDPGQDGWVDKSGRRRKRAFLELVGETFQRPPEPVERGQPKEKRFTTVFEDIFQLFAQMSAPGTDCLTDQELKDQAHDLAIRLETFSLREAPDAALDIKVAAVWSCYHQSTPIRVLHDQDRPPKRFNSVWDSTKTLANFVFGAVGVSVVLGWILHLSWKDVAAAWGRLVSLPPVGELTRWLLHLPLLGSLLLEGRRLSETIRQDVNASWLETLWCWNPHPMMHLGKVVVILLACLIILRMTAAFYSWLKGPNHEPKSMPLLPVAAWLPVQVVFAAPLLLQAFLLFFVGGPIVSALGRMGFHRTFGLYDERDGKRDSPPPPHLFPETSRSRRWASRTFMRLNSFRLVFAWIARRPLLWVRACVAKDSVVASLADAMDNQFAFWEMQRLGVEAGCEAAAFLEKMLTPQTMPGGSKDKVIAGAFHEAVRLHFIGHSFGGLVITNAARLLALNKERAVQAQNVKTYRRVNIHSVVLLQAAIASSWFEKEEILRRSVKGAIGNIYSRYDSANGFYYPLANSGRQAAGSVGLFGVGRDKITRRPYTVETVGSGGRLASLVKPPDLAGWATVPPAGEPYLLNLDASRLISEGNVALGGGHNDIFKDDVVNLAWAVSRLKMPTVVAAVPPAAPAQTGSPPPSGLPPRGPDQEPAGARRNGPARAGGRNGRGIVLAVMAVAQVALAAVLLAQRPQTAHQKAAENERLLD